MTITIFDKPNNTRTRFALSYLGYTQFFAWSAKHDLFGDQLSRPVRTKVQAAFQTAFRSNHDWNSPQPFQYEC